MTNRTLVVPDRPRTVLIAAGVVALIASLAGLVLGWILVDSVSDDLASSVGLSTSALLAIEETLGVVESVADDLDQGLAAASDSIAAASAAAGTASGRLEEVADFLDGDLKENIEALQGSMPAAIQAAGAIDDTLRALALFGVDYDPEQPFDESLMALDTALGNLPGQLTAQAESVRALVPTSEQFAEDAGALAESFTALSIDLGESEEILADYRRTLEQAQGVVDETGSSLTANTWLLRLLILMAAIAGSALSIGLILLGSRLRVEVVEPAE